MRCLHRAGKLGLSSAVIEGWKAARHESVALGAMDADFSHDIDACQKWSRRSIRASTDWPSAAVTCRAAASPTGPKRRIVTSRVACWLARPLTRVKDVTSGYFLVRREALEGVTLDPIGFKIGLEVIAKARYGKAIEVPYVFTDRVAGESKLNEREIFNYLKQLRQALLGVALPARATQRHA